MRKATGRDRNDAGRGQCQGGAPPKPSSTTPARDPCAAQPAATAPPPAGLDPARHAAAQRAARQAEAIREGAFPALMASALPLDRFFDGDAYRVYLGLVMADLGAPADPVERMLIEQLCLAHFRTAALQVGAGQARGTEAVKLYSAAAARMLGEMRRTALAIRAYRSAAPAGEARQKVKLFKAAQ